MRSGPRLTDHQLPNRSSVEMRPRSIDAWRAQRRLRRNEVCWAVACRSVPWPARTNSIVWRRMTAAFKGGAPAAAAPLRRSSPLTAAPHAVTPRGVRRCKPPVASTRTCPPVLRHQTTRAKALVVGFFGTGHCASEAHLFAIGQHDSAKLRIQQNRTERVP